MLQFTKYTVVEKKKLDGGPYAFPNFVSLEVAKLGFKPWPHINGPWSNKSTQYLLIIKAIKMVNDFTPFSEIRRISRRSIFLLEDILSELTH